MKKNLIYSALAASMMAGLASCSSEEIVSGYDKDGGIVTFTANSPHQ
jgi:hypothetical protein